MDRRIIWTIRAMQITPTRKKLEELSQRDDLFDESLLNPRSYEYKKTVKSFEKAAQTGCSAVTFIDKEYPECLRHISMPPPVLFVRGNVAVLNGIVYAGIVGCRKADVYGMQTAGNIAREVGALGAGVVSGGAEGVDKAAHEGALLVKAPTIAVLGCGLDIDYPKSNAQLFKRIAENGGAVISEFHFGERPNKRNFPHRNRIIAAFSTAVVVTRAGKRSGAIITANQAIAMNKTVFAVPGNTDHKLSVGTNELIRDGALVLLSPMDIIDELISKNPDFFVKEREPVDAVSDLKVYEEEFKSEKKNNASLSEYESEILNIIENGFKTQNLIEEKITFDPARLSGLLGMMELKGIIRRSADKSYNIL